MTNSKPRDPNPLKPGSDWTGAKPDHMPLPTAWPAGLGLAATLIVWGLITSWIISAVGLALFAAAIAGWIIEIRHERATR